MSHLSIINLLGSAAWVVQLILVVLLLVSIQTWQIIIHKYLQLRTAKETIISFNERYNSSHSINTLFAELNSSDDIMHTTTNIFFTCIKEYHKLLKDSVSDKDIIITNLQRTIESSIIQQLNRFESRLSTLANAATLSPYIGLLGTVFGIMQTFSTLTASNNTLTLVAPGITEALIATASGLLVAIPASNAYNKYLASIVTLECSMQDFSNELLNLISRKLSGTKI